MSSLYVYYKVTASDAGAVLVCARTLLARVAQLTGIDGRLLRRQEQVGTWMEVYDPVDDLDALEHAIQAALPESGFSAALTSGVRHSERFVPLEPADLAHLSQ